MQWEIGQVAHLVFIAASPRGTINRFTDAIGVHNELTIGARFHQLHGIAHEFSIQEVIF